MSRGPRHVASTHPLMRALKDAYTGIDEVVRKLRIQWWENLQANVYQRGLRLLPPQLAIGTEPDATLVCMLRRQFRRPRH